MRMASLKLLLLVSYVLPSAGSSPLVISPSNSVWVLHPDDVGFNATAPVALALRDLQADWYKVLGTRPATVKGSQCPAGFEGTCIFFGKAASIASPHPPSSGHPEAHAIVVSGNNVYMTGNSVRGQVYAAYAFSERVLGVEPLWWWTDTEPRYRGTLTFADPATDVAIDYGAPVFQHRGWFPNDEDLLGNFNPDPLGQSMFSAQTWNRIAEALLRLKGNLVIAGTVSFPDESHYDVLKRRGVAASMQHFTMLGVNTWRWPEGIPYSFNANPEIQEFVWKASVEEYAGREAVWTIGYRGLNDYPFWDDEPSFNTTAKRCELISAAMQKQADIVRATPGRESDVCVTYLWAEMLDLYLTGNLTIPENTTTVFADSGGQGTFDPRVYDKLSKGDGVYFHVQMESPGKMSQLTEMVPPASFYREMRRFVAAGATSYFTLNLSDLKPAAFLVDTIMRYLWNPTIADSSKSPEAAQEAAISSWSVRFFGDTFAKRASDVIGGYFNISYVSASGNDSRRYGDEHLSGLVRQILTNSSAATTALEFVETPLKQLEPLFASAQALHTDMQAAGAPGGPFFQASFLLFVATHWFGCRAVLHTAKGNFTGARAELASLREYQRNAEQVKWRGLYGADRLVDFGNLDCLLKSAAEDTGVNNGDPVTCNLPNGASYHSGTGKWSDWFEYANTTANFPYLNAKADDSKSMDLVVRVLCDQVSVDGSSTCENTPVGGVFKKQAKISMMVPKPDGVTIRFTLDGSEPTTDSTPYSKPFVIQNTTRIAAKAFLVKQTVGHGSRYEGGSSYPTLVTRPVFRLVE